MKCLDCGKRIPDEGATDIELCPKCTLNYSVERLWNDHDAGEIDALDFNESADMRQKYRRTLSEQ